MCPELVLMRPELVEGRFRRGLDKLSPQLRVMGGLVLLVSDRLELEGAVRDIEMSAEAFTEPIQYLT